MTTIGTTVTGVWLAMGITIAPAPCVGVAIGLAEADPG